MSKVEEISGQNLLSCYQCGLCSAGCPMSFAMAILPRQIIRLAQLGMDDEIDYHGDVETVHLLEVLRDDVGWEAIAGKVKVPLKDLIVAPYYGCTLIRTREIAIDDVERPTVLHRLMDTLGATVVDFPLVATKCCGSFQSVSNPDLAAETAWNILTLAQRQGAEALVLARCASIGSWRKPELKPTVWHPYCSPITLTPRSGRGN